MLIDCKFTNEQQPGSQLSRNIKYAGALKRIADISAEQVNELNKEDLIPLLDRIEDELDEST